MKPLLKHLWERTSHAWAALQVERQGKYSVERLYQLHNYQHTTTLIRLWVIVLLMPLPCLAAVTLLDVIPLNPPSAGLAHSHLCWIRTFLMTCIFNLSVMTQLHHIVPRLPVTTTQIW